MKSEKPKVAVELAGKPLLAHVLDHLYAAGFRKFSIIVGYKREQVQAIAEPFRSRPDVDLSFAIQEEQKGTAHAFLSAEGTLRDHVGPVMVASGDMPAIRPETYQALASFHATGANRATVLSAMLEDPTGYGRIVRDAAHKLSAIVEEKDASEQTRAIHEVNTGTYIFECPEVFSVLREVGSNNAQGEYYLPDVVALYRARGQGVNALSLDDSGEAQGVNSPVELNRLEERLKAMR